MLFLVIVIAVNRESPKTHNTPVNPADFESTEFPDDEITIPSQIEESTTEKVYEYEKIGSVKKDLTGELVIPETLDNLPVRSIARGAFGVPGSYSTFPGYSISSLVLPDNLYKISEDAFYRCVNLSSVSFGKNIQFIGSAAFFKTTIKSIDIPDSVTEISDYVFKDCGSLEKITIGKGINKLPAYLFQNCANLNTLIIPGNVGEIDTTIIDVGLGGQSNPTIYGEAGTAAARFASSKGLTFKLLETQ